MMPTSKGLFDFVVSSMSESLFLLCKPACWRACQWADAAGPGAAIQDFLFVAVSEELFALTLVLQVKQTCRMQIHIARDGQKMGPFTLEEVNRQLAAGILRLSDLA